jgi:hypothetical protein
MDFEALKREFAQGPAILEARIRPLDKATLNRRPAYEDAWTIKEHVIHLADCDTNGFIRIKSIIAQPGTECYVMDEDLWTRNLRRTDEDVEKYLKLFSLIRSIVAELVEGEAANPGFFTRTYKGEVRKIDIPGCLEIYVKHLKFHLEYIDKIVDGKV